VRVAHRLYAISADERAFGRVSERSYSRFARDEFL